MKQASAPVRASYGTGISDGVAAGVTTRWASPFRVAAQFAGWLQRAQVLQHDLIKSYVRLPDLQQKRLVEFAHGIGVPAATHEIYPAAFIGVDNTEHTGATSRRGYSPKMATMQRASA